MDEEVEMDRMDEQIETWIGGWMDRLGVDGVADWMADF